MTKPSFGFRSRMWTNLHERLLACVRPAMRKPEPCELEGAAYAPALALYRERFAARPWFDDELSQIARSLARDSLAIDPDVRAVLEQAGAAYRTERWPADDQTNRAFITALEPRLAKHAPALVAEITRLLGSPWPGTIEVEVAVRAGPVGAYTITQPALVRVSSTRYEGDGALEMVFHEAAHELIAPTKQALDEGCAARNGDGKDLWHALLFYTTGETIRRALPGYVPHADRLGLWKRWERYHAALVATWQPYLDGKVTREAALAALLDSGVCT